MTTLEQLAKEAASCTRCDLYERATATVFGEGVPGSPLALVGEQPGDQEDKQGHPFVGPAGHVSSRLAAPTNPVAGPAQRGRPRAAFDDNPLPRWPLLEAHQKARVPLGNRLEEHLYGRFFDFGRGSHVRRIEPEPSVILVIRRAAARRGGKPGEGDCLRECEPRPHGGFSLKAPGELLPFKR